MWRPLAMKVSLNQRQLKTGVLLLAYVGVGLTQSLLGPTLLDMRILVSVSEERASLIIPADYSGYALGGLMVILGGSLINIQIATACCMVIATGTAIMVPFQRDLGYLCTVLFANGFCCGLIESATLSSIMYIWGDQSAFPLQLMAFIYGCGATAGPALAKPYLLDEHHHGNNSRPITGEDVQIIYPYIAAAIYEFIAVGVYVIAYVIYPNDIQHSSRRFEHLLDHDENGNSKNSKNETGNSRKWSIIVMAAVFYQFFDGMNYVQANYIVSYATKSGLNLGKQDGAAMSTASWAIYAVLSGCSLFFIRSVNLRKNILFQMAILSASCLTYVFLAQNFALGLWAAVVLQAIGGYSIFSSIFSLLETCFPVSSNVTAFIMLTATIGDITWPFIVGNFIEIWPPIFIYVITGTFIASFISFLIFITLIDKD